MVYSDIYYGIYGLYAPEYFYAWAGQIATTDTVRYLIQQGRMELPKEEKTPYVKSVGVGSGFDTGYDGTTVGYSEAGEYTGTTGYDGTTVGYLEAADYTGTTVGYSEAADYTGTFGDGSVQSYVNTDGVAANGHMSRTNDGSTVAREHIAATGNGSKTAAGSLGENSNVGANIQAEYETVPEYYSEDRERFIPDGILVDTEKQRLIREYIESLSPFSKAVLQYYYYEAVSLKYIAETIGCSSNVIRKSLYEVKSRLKVLLGTDGGYSEGTAISDGINAVALYDMSSLPVLWLIFQSSLTNVPVSTLMAGTAVGAGAAATGVTAATGAAAGLSAGVGAAETGMAVGTGIAAEGAGAGIAAGGVAGTGAVAGGTAGSGAVAGGVAATGAVATGTAASSVAAGTGIATGIKVAIAIGATALIGGGVAATAHFVSNSKATTEISTEVVAEETAETTAETTTEATTEITTEATTEETTKTAEELNAESISGVS